MPILLPVTDNLALLESAEKGFFSTKNVPDTRVDLGTDYEADTLSTELQGPVMTKAFLMQTVKTQSLPKAQMPHWFLGFLAYKEILVKDCYDHGPHGKSKTYKIIL